MSTFAVIFTGKTDLSAAGSRLMKSFPDAYNLNRSTFMVRADSLSSEIAEAVGIKGDNREYTGVVFKVNHSYSGYTARDFWEWLRDDE